MVKILECTLRDGSYAIDYQFSYEDTKNIAKALEDVGFEYIEIGHGVGMGASESGRGQAKETDEMYLKAVSEVLTKSKFGMFFVVGVGKKEHLDLAKKYGMHFVRIGVNITESEKAKEFVFYAKKLGFEIHLNFMKSYTVTKEEFIEKAMLADSWGVDVIAIVDSAGCMYPAEIGDLVRELKRKVKAKVGFHGHNNLQLVTVNCMEAIRGGADFVDGTLRGMGRSAGNAQTEILLIILDKLGKKMDINLYDVMDISEKIVVPLMTRTQGMTDIEVISGLSGCHSYFLPLFKEIAEQHDVDMRKLIVNVSKIDRVRPTRELIIKEAKKL